MATTLSMSDFKLYRAICELRYVDAYLLYDRTGEIAQAISSIFTDLKVVSPTPNQTSFQCKEGAIGLELNACRFMAERPDLSLEQFAEHCEKFFAVVIESLGINVFTRIGLRLIFRYKTNNLADAKAALKTLNLADFGSRIWFGAASIPDEILFRWENDEIGTMLRLKAESGNIDVTFPAELELSEPMLHQNISGVTLDVDYYASAPVERSQWSATAWIPPSGRRIRKEVDHLMGR